MRFPRPIYALAAIAALASACGSSTPLTQIAPALTTTTTVAPTTIPPTTVAETTTTVQETTTVAPAVVEAVALPRPISAPADARGAESSNALGTIAIPAIGLSMTMLEGIRLTTLDQGPGHWPGTALPGQVGNVVVAGHRTSHSKPFRHLDALSPGDEVIFSMPNGQFTYHVVSTEIVLPSQVDIINQTSAKTATLFACNPPGSTRERIVVHLAYSGA